MESKHLRNLTSSWRIYCSHTEWRGWGRKFFFKLLVLEIIYNQYPEEERRHVFMDGKQQQWHANFLPFTYHLAQIQPALTLSRKKFTFMLHKLCTLWSIIKNKMNFYTTILVQFYALHTSYNSNFCCKTHLHSTVWVKHNLSSAAYYMGPNSFVLEGARKLWCGWWEREGNIYTVQNQSTD